MEELLRTAAAGDPQAQYELALHHDNLEGDARDPAEAARWYRLAADQGLAGSQAMLATMYEKGVGVACDAAEAARWQALAEKANDAR